MIEVTVSPERVKETLEFVKAMREAKQKHNVTDKMFDRNNTSEGINIIGHLGEQAVGQALGFPVDTTVLVGGDDGSDMKANGMTIQVKTSQLKSLIFNAPWLFKSDIAIQVQYIGKDKTKSEEDPRFIIWGYIDKKTFSNNHYKKDYGYGERLVMDIEHLNSIEELIKHPPERFRDKANAE